MNCMFPDEQIVLTVSAQLSWSNFLELMRQWHRFWQEEAVIAKQVVSQNDSITMKGVGELLSVKDSRAREVLKALTDRGLLRKQGTARSTYYVRVEV